MFSAVFLRVPTNHSELIPQVVFDPVSCTNARVSFGRLQKLDKPALSILIMTTVRTRAEWERRFVILSFLSGIVG